MKTNNRLHLFILAITSIFIVAGCTEDTIAPLENNMTPPGKVTNITVESLPGAAKLTYSLPSDQDLLYVKAVYPIQNGKREIKSSYYTNSMIVDGFADTNEHEVILYAVNRSEVASEPVTVKIQPKENPIWDVFRSLQILPDFAGVKVIAENPYSANVVIEVIKQDERGKWEPFYPYVYSSAKSISQTTRGLDTIPYQFGVTVRDNFINYTDTLYTTVTPYYEMLLDKSLFKTYKLPGDALIQTVTAGMPLMWDGETYHFASRMLTDMVDQKPQFVTIDMGQLAKLSRIKIWNYSEFMSDGNHQFYYRGQLRFFEIWGSDNPNQDGSWDNWIKLGTFENIKPSGLPYGQNSNEDWETAIAGFDYNFDTNVQKVRYLRIKCLENWMGTTWFEILEISVYGDKR
ncbi:MAG: hypothetical protein BGO29_14680 [Bacteroidales bacterium 36-12]|nr:MAG: hypothetical protein BGO29_14680 [Bacteroidales bacterium 36-12]